MNRFVVLRHEISEANSFERKSHFDLMLEAPDALGICTLRTWALDQWPLEPAEATTAIPLPDHRLAYLEYEGPISGNRGSVHRVARGTYTVDSETTNSLTVRLNDGTQECMIVLAEGMAINAT
jgi:hypothetical protein